MIMSLHWPTNQKEEENKMAGRRLSLDQKVKCVRLFSKTNNISEVQRQMEVEFGRPKPTRDTIARLNKTFDETGSVGEGKRSGRPKSVVTPENKEIVMQELNRSPDKAKSQRRLSSVLNIKRRSLQRIMKDLKLRPYHPRLINALQEDDPDRRLQFAEEWMTMLQNNPDLATHVIWTDEAKFHLSGCVNRHNCVYWRENNPEITIEIDKKSPGVMVWAGLSYEGVTGPFFLEGNVNGNSYLELLQQEVHPLLMERDDYDMLWWQQDGAPPHYACVVRDWLNQTFPGRWIGRRGTFEWPPRSPDLTPPDFFLWGYLKDKVYSHRIQDIDHLRDIIVQECNEITLEMCRAACDNVALRLQACIDVNGAQVDIAMENRN